MVLEETLLFHHEDDANEFIKFLKKQDCHAVKKKEGVILQELLMKGSIGNVIAMLEEITESDGEDAPEQEAEAQDLLASALSKPLRQGRIPQDAMNDILLRNLKLTREYLTDIMTRFKEGDLLYSREFLNGMKEDIQSRLDQEGETDLARAFRETIPLFTSLMVMEANGLISKGPAGITLVKTMDPKDVVVEQRVIDPDFFDEETLKEYQIALSRTLDFETQTRVLIEPSLYFSCDPEDLEEVLLNLDVDDESANSLMYNYVHKYIAIEKIVQILKTTSKLSLKEIIQQMNTFVSDFREDEYPTTVYTTPEFITSLIHDMRKAKMIQGTDDRIRLAR